MARITIMATSAQKVRFGTGHGGLTSRRDHVSISTTLDILRT
jgi:hypothetical protein